MSKNLLNGDIEFDSPAARIVKQFSEDTKEQFRIPVNLPDLSFLRALSVQGRLIYRIGTATTTGTVISIVPDTGQTVFVYRFFGESTGNRVFTNTLVNNGNIRIQIITVTTLASQAVNIVDSLVGDGVKALTIETDVSGSTGTLTMTLLGWVENTSRIRDVTI